MCEGMDNPKCRSSAFPLVKVLLSTAYNKLCLCELKEDGMRVKCVFTLAPMFISLYHSQVKKTNQKNIICDKHNCPNVILDPKRAE